MPINTATVTPHVGLPRGAAAIAGRTLGGVVEIETQENNLFVPGSFTLHLARSEMRPPYDCAYFAAVTEAPQAELHLGYGGGDPETIRPADLGQLGPPVFVGLIEHYVEFVGTDAIELSGRDLSALLVEAKTTEKFANMSSAQVVTILAQRHGLTPNVATQDDAAGIYYGADQARLTSQHSEWEILTFLAQKQQCNVWVSGRTLNFQPAPQQGDAADWIVSLPPARANQPDPVACNVLLDRESRLERKLLLAGQVNVTVQSWNSQAKRVYKRTATSKPRQTRVAQTPQVHAYTYNIAGLTDAQTKERAQQIAEDIVRHERFGHFVQEGDNRLTAQMLLALQGTGTAFDQSYFIDEIRRHLSLEGGYTMELSPKNHSPRDVEVS